MLIERFWSLNHEGVRYLHRRQVQDTPTTKAVLGLFPRSGIGHVIFISVSTKALYCMYVLAITKDHGDAMI